DSRSERPTWIGYCDESARTATGRKKLFQSAAKLKKKTSATMGLASGSATRRNVCHSLAPSTRAASGRSPGIVVAEEMYARYTPNGKNENGRMTENTLPIRCTELSSRKIGSTSAAAGMII